MDLDMFSHPTTLRNLNTLRSFGNIIIEPATGELASGLEGKGRMEEPENIVKALVSFFQSAGEMVLLHKKVMVTAGPTYEAIDPVRYIGNYSSGKMGFAIAEELAKRGAIVILVSGPVSLKPSHPGIQLIKVSSAEEMYEVCNTRFAHMDAAILSAAVADFTPVNPLPEKVKREKENYVLELKPTIDIAAHLGKMKKASQVLAGFALETSNEMANAQKKLRSKNLDFIVLNSLNDPGAGFQTDTNKITIIDKNNNIQKFELKQKAEVATDIVNKLVTFF
jgi:phosphopantothenoylcysteine decarboxylase/phosphopantothenate--cysteine ligase